MAQGRRDFLFGIDQGTRASSSSRAEGALRRPPRARAVHLPGRGHRLPHDQMRAWFDCYLARTGCDGARRRLVAPEKFGGQVAAWTTLPPGTTTLAFPGVTTFARSGKAVRTSAPLRKSIEIFGAPTVQTRSPRAAAGRGSSRCSPRARRRARRSSSAPAASRRRPARAEGHDPPPDQATFVPKGSRLTLTLASSSTAQSLGEPPLPRPARCRRGRERVSARRCSKLPGLRTPVTK